MKNLIARALITLIVTVGMITSGFASQFPDGSIANTTVTYVENLTKAADRDAAIAAVPALLTSIEALDNDTTIPTNELVGIRTYIGAFRSISSAIAVRVDAAVVQLAGIIAAKRAAL